MNNKVVRELLKKEWVVEVKEGTKIRGGVDTGEHAIVVGVIAKKPSSALNEEDIVPAYIGKIQTDVIEVGEIFLLGVRTDKHRPAPGGVSIGHKDITAGTFGSSVRKDEERLMLSNKHIFAPDGAEIGDELLQPAPYDGGTLSDEIGRLVEFVPIEYETSPGVCKLSNFAAWFLSKVCKLFGRNHFLQSVREGDINLVDAALGRPLTSTLISDTIPGIGEVHGDTEAYKGMDALFSGRTSGELATSITATGVTIKVNMGNGKYAIFGDQVEIAPPPQGGDSGSLLVVANGDEGWPMALGLVFAGSSKVGFANRFANVKHALGIEI